MISLRARKQLRDFTLDVAFEVPEGQCLALVGPTGCGKTTCLRILAGLLQPDEGEVRLGDTIALDTARHIDVSPQDRRVGMVFQDYSLFPHMTVAQNVAYGARARGLGRRQAHEAALAALETVGMAAQASVQPTQLSGGQQQRVALARALASGARVLLMDEPMSALDATTRRQVRAELRQLLKSLGRTTIVVTHDVVDALTLGDVLCVMREGRIVQQGDRRELLSRPRDRFVAEFLGINLLEGMAEAGPDGLTAIRCGDATFYSSDDVRGEVLLTCNPRDIVVSREAPDDSSLNVLHGRVAGLAHFGAQTRVAIENGINLTAEITHLSEARLDLKPGDEVYAAFKASATHVYA
jgi:molybdate transport system ATP-binding protein